MPMPIPFLDLTLTPFFITLIFIFAVVYGALGAAGVFKQKGVNVAIAIAFALFAASYQPLVSGLQQFLPIAAIIIILLFFVLLVKKVFGGDDENKGKSQTFDSVPLAIGLGLALIVLGAVWRDVASLLPSGISPANALWLIAVVVVLIIFLAIYRHQEPPERKQ